jgi:phage tail sheath gpL-like
MAAVAPYESCIACLKGDVSTAVAFRGEAEFIIAGIHKAAGIPVELATATFAAFAEQELGCDPGTVPTGQVTHAVRLCTDCAQRTGTTVAPVPDVPCYEQGKAT